MTAAPMSRAEIVARLRTHWDTGFALDDLVTAAADMIEADGQQPRQRIGEQPIPEEIEALIKRLRELTDWELPLAIDWLRKWPRQTPGGNHD